MRLHVYMHSWSTIKLLYANWKWRDVLAEDRYDVIKWRRFLCYWPFVRGNNRSSAYSHHKGQWRGVNYDAIVLWHDDVMKWKHFPRYWPFVRGEPNIHLRQLLWSHTYWATSFAMKRFSLFKIFALGNQHQQNDNSDVIIPGHLSSAEWMSSTMRSRYLAVPCLQMTHERHLWWRHQMETFSALLAICAGNSPVPGEFPTQRPVTQNFGVCFDLRPNKRLSKQSWSWWFETPSCPLWRHRNAKLPR